MLHQSPCFIASYRHYLLTLLPDYCTGFPLFFQDGIPWLFPDFPWLLKWNSRYPVNSKNGSFWKINVILLLSAPPPLHRLHAFSIFFQFFFFFNFFLFFQFFLLYFIIYRISRSFFLSCSFIHFPFFLLFPWLHLKFPDFSLTTQIPWFSLTFQVGGNAAICTTYKSPKMAYNCPAW